MQAFWVKSLGPIVKNLHVGVQSGNMGTHSARKGAATYASGGCTISPSMSAICNHAWWKMGGRESDIICQNNWLFIF